MLIAGYAQEVSSRRKDRRNRTQFDHSLNVARKMSCLCPSSSWGRRRYVFGLFVRLCVRACVAEAEAFPAGLLSTSSFYLW